MSERAAATGEEPSFQFLVDDIGTFSRQLGPR